MLSTSVNATRKRSEVRAEQAQRDDGAPPLASSIGLKFAWDAELPAAQKLLLEKPLRRWTEDASESVVILMTTKTGFPNWIEPMH